MASQKEKYLSSAQKFIQKGQFDRAIRDYEQIVAADPGDVRHRQKLAELLARCNRNEEAVREYETIARFYEENGFYLKAIAVFKQIQRLDSRNIEISLTLAALNEKQGLIGNALSEYKYVFDYYEKEGNSAEACKILEKMHAVDPDNIDIRLKLAETCFAAGNHDDAYQEYTRAALMLKGRGNDAVFDKVCSRIQTLFPEKKEFILDLLEEQIKSGMVEDVIPRLKQMLEGDESNRRVLSLYVEACKTQGDLTERKYACERMLQYFPSDAASKEGLIECCVEEGNLEDSLEMIELYAHDLISAGLFGSLEKSYTSLQSQAPYDTRILEGLKRLYESTGDQAKLADVQVSLKILSGDASGGRPGISEDEENRAENVSLAEEPHAGMEIDFPWDEAIDLSVCLEETENASSYTSDVENLSTPPDFMEGGEETPFTRSAELSEEHFIDDEFKQESKKAEQFPDSLHISLEDNLFEVEFEESVELEEIEESTPLEPVPDEEKSQQDWLSVDLSREMDVDARKEGFPGVPPVENALSEVEKHFLDDVLSEPEDELDDQLDKGDTETRFNLGIAYKEMGLFEEAMKEFKAAAVNPLRTVDCLLLQGICLREKGEPEKAEKVLIHGIDLFKPEPEKALTLKYELGLLFETSGRTEDALQVFREVFAANPGFRDTAGKIARLHGTGELPDFSDIDEVDIKLEGMK